MRGMKKLSKFQESTFLAPSIYISHCVTWTECASILIFFPALGYLIISRMEIWHPRINCDSCSTSAVTFTLQLVCLQSCSTAAVVEWRSWYVSSKEYNLIVFWAVKGNTIFNTAQTSIQYKVTDAEISEICRTEIEVEGHRIQFTKCLLKCITAATGADTYCEVAQLQGQLLPFTWWLLLLLLIILLVLLF